MKRSLNIILLILSIFIFLEVDVVFAAKELVCIYEGGTQNSPTMLIQDANGIFSVKINYYGDYTDKDDKDWYAASDDHEYSLDFDDTNSYQNGELTSCPPYLQHPAFNTYKLAFHDSTSGWRLDYDLYEEYEGTLDDDNYKQNFDSDEDYSEEIKNTEWLATCNYYDDSGNLSTKLYFNREKFIFESQSSLTNRISSDFSLNELLELYDRRGKCPELYGDYDCYAVIGNTFCNVEYSLNKSFGNSDDVDPGNDSIIDDPEHPLNNKHEIDELTTCSSLLGDPNKSNPASPAYYMSFAFSVIRYIAIILLIVLTIMDFASAVASQDNDILKKATTKAIKRAILCVIIFLLPTLIDFILQFIHDSSISDCINSRS